MGDDRSPAVRNFESEADIYNELESKLSRASKERDKVKSFDVNNIEQAVTAFQSLSREISIDKQVLKDIKKEIANTTDETRKSALLKQQEALEKQLEKNKSQLGAIKNAQGALVEDKVKEIKAEEAHAAAIANILAEKELQAKIDSKHLDTIKKENELILQGRGLELEGIESEAEARERYNKNYNEIKASEQKEKDEKTKAQFMSENGVGGKAVNLGSQLDRVTGGKFNIEATISRAMSNLDAGMMKALSGIQNMLSNIGKKLDDSIKNASEFLDANYTKVNAALKGTDYTFNSIQEDVKNNLGVNRFVKQTDYLSTIAKLTEEGISFNLEERALLETIKDKSVASFSATDDAITRLTRYLKQDVTSSQFGIEYTLRNTLNGMFGDSSYINKLYDSVTSAIEDAALAIEGRDITPFNSAVNTWLSYMYEYGLSDSVVSKLAEGINYLGSGNVSALAANPDLQRLFLLSMDTAGLNYADILQQGLDVDTTNVLIKSIISYLDKIVNNTADNLVLQNSYANLFNMSITDMKAIQELARTNINYLANSNSARAATYSAVADIANDTLYATQIDNMLENALYTYGLDIATDNGKYVAYKLSDLIMNITEPFTEVKGAVGTVANAAQLVSTIGKFAVTTLGVMSIAESVFSGGLGNTQGTLGSMLNLGGAELKIADTGISRMNGMRSSAANLNMSNSGQGSKGLDSANRVSEMVGEESDWTTDDHDILDILKEFEKAIMKSNVSNNYAVAVSLEGMNDEVLTSFASIFADEDAMLKTYEGKNNVIERSLFNYVDRVGVPSDKLKENTGTAGKKPNTEE